MIQSVPPQLLTKLQRMTLMFRSKASKAGNPVAWMDKEDADTLEEVVKTFEWATMEIMNLRKGNDKLLEFIQKQIDEKAKSA